MYLKKTPIFIQKLFPQFVWNIQDDSKSLYLSFDDGPEVGITDWVLDLLAAHNASATFFCLGGNVARQPELYQRIIDEGHSVGNHSQSHLSGWESSNKEYYRDVLQAGNHIQSQLFRPPYGRLKRKQAAALLNRYKIIMWDVMSGDFDFEISPETVYNNVVKKSKPGSIVVFHDNLKAEENLRVVLPKVLKHYSEQGYTFKAITNEQLEQSTAIRKSA